MCSCADDTEADDGAMLAPSRSPTLALLFGLALAMSVVGFLNFLWFVAESQALGGDALNGYARDGRWFVGSHGTYTEVTRDAWEWSLAHGRSMLFTHVLGMLGLGYVVIRHVIPELRARQDALAAGRKPPAPSAELRIALLVGLGLGAVFAVSFVARNPAGGLFGLISTVLVVVILAVNLLRYLPLLVGTRQDPAASPSSSHGPSQVQAVAPQRFGGVTAKDLANLLGVVGFALFVAAGLFLVIPAMGLFGVLWTLVAALILAKVVQDFLNGV